MNKIIQTQNAPKPAGPYIQGVRVDKFLLVSGQVAGKLAIGFCIWEKRNNTKKMKNEVNWENLDEWN